MPLRQMVEDKHGTSVGSSSGSGKNECVGRIRKRKRAGRSSGLPCQVSPTV